MTTAKVTKYKDPSTLNIFGVGDLVYCTNGYTTYIVLVTRPTNKKGYFGGTIVANPTGKGSYTIGNNHTMFLAKEYKPFYGSITLKSTRDEQSKY